jgi:prophage DNA circulation protein
MADDIMGKLEALQGGASNIGQNLQSNTDANRQLAHEATVFWKTYAKLKGSWEADPKGATSIRKQKSVVGKAAGKVSKEVQTVKKKMGLLGKIIAGIGATAAAGFMVVKGIWEGGRWIFEKLKDWATDDPKEIKNMGKLIKEPGSGGSKLSREMTGGLQSSLPNSPFQSSAADMTKTEQSIDVSNRYLSEIASSLRNITRGGSASGGSAPRQARYPSSSNTYASQPPMGGGGGPGLVSGRMSYWDSANNMNGDGIPQGMV